MGFFNRDRSEAPQSAPNSGVSVTLICANYSGDERVTLRQGATVADAIETATGTRPPSASESEGYSSESSRGNRWVCRVNGGLASPETPLASGDRVLIAPRKIDGACSR